MEDLGIKDMGEMRWIREMQATIYIVDTRSIPVIVTLEGKMELPYATTMKSGHKFRWHFENFLEPPVAVIDQIRGSQVSLIFPFMAEQDAKDTSGKLLSTEDIVSIFLKEEDGLKYKNKEIR